MELHPQLALNSCPHCSVAKPNLVRKGILQSHDHAGRNARIWATYICGSCGGAVTACATGDGKPVLAYFPMSRIVSEDIPAKPKLFLEQALSTIHAPAASIMVAGSAVDSMLKEKGYTKESLYNRIDKAAIDHLITRDMAEWAHDVRLDANDQRHADERAGLPTTADAERVVEFALAIAEYLFVLPARTKRGMKETGQINNTINNKGHD